MAPRPAVAFTNRCVSGPCIAPMIVTVTPVSGFSDAPVSNANPLVAGIVRFEAMR